MSSTPANHQPRVLVIDDNAAIHEDFRKILGGQTAADSRLSSAEKALFGTEEPTIERVQFRIDSAFQGQDALKMVQEAMEKNDPYELAFVDVRMPPGWDGIETLEHIWKCSPDLQAVICTAYSDYSWDDMLRRFGQTDNLIILKKPFETVEVLQIAHAMTRKWELGQQARLRMEDLDKMVQERTQKLQQEVEERARVQEALRISEERFSKAFQASPIPMAIKSLPEGRFLAANSSFYELSGYAADQLIQRSVDELNLWENSEKRKAAATKSENRIRNFSCNMRRNDGTMRNVVLWTEPVTLDTTSCLLLIVEDVTNRLRLESELRQAQKMEIVGRLTASIAHEFNNLLTVIQGHASMLRDSTAMANKQFANDSVERIVQASQRAATFTGQLLSFSRKQPLQQLKALEISGVVHNTRKMLGQLLGERHELRLECAQNLPFTRVNEGGIEQILVNLLLNARDSMPEGGPITIGTSLEVIDEDSARKNPDVRAGRFVCLSVADAGGGMNTEILSRIFDPFFTTKEVGKGTGLGLSTVQTIVQQHKGWIEVKSRPSQGSTFKIFLPVWEEAPVPTKPTPPPPVESRSLQRGAGETVLVVEDEAAVRELARVALEQGGYVVLEAADGHEALKVWDQSPTRIDVLIADMVLPNGLNGGALARMLQVRDPALRVVCTSGYNPDFIKKDLPTTKGIMFLPKPYDPTLLLKTIKNSLNGTNRVQNPNGNGKKTEFLTATTA